MERLGTRISGFASRFGSPNGRSGRIVASAISQREDVLGGGRSRSRGATPSRFARKHRRRARGSGARGSLARWRGASTAHRASRRKQIRRRARAESVVTLATRRDATDGDASGEDAPRSPPPWCPCFLRCRPCPWCSGGWCSAPVARRAMPPDPLCSSAWSAAQSHPTGARCWRSTCECLPLWRICEDGPWFNLGRRATQKIARRLAPKPRKSAGEANDRASSDAARAYPDARASTARPLPRSRASNRTHRASLVERHASSVGVYAACYRASR